jgi:hypothetical protein
MAADLRGAFDLHVHSAPCLFPRLTDDLTAARAVAAHGLAGIVLKSHHEPTSGRAAVVTAALAEAYPGFRAFGSITLNHAVGGVNPAAVEAALRLGARIVWLPTVDSTAHHAAFGGASGWDVQHARQALRPQPALSVLHEGHLTDTAHDVLRLCHEAGCALATGHTGPAEVLALIEAARALRFERLIVTHPLFRVPGFTPGQLAGLTGEGVWFEFTYCSLSPMWQHTTIDDTVAAIRAVGVGRAFVSSDGGQTHNPPAHEGLRLMAQMCLERGIADARRLVVDAPRYLLGLHGRE